MGPSPQKLPLVNYSDSESDQEPDTDNLLKRKPVQDIKSSLPENRKRLAGDENSINDPAVSIKRQRNGAKPQTGLPPLPEAFFNLYTTAPRTATSDDPSLHGGFEREVPHRAGHWPTHVSLEWMPTKYLGERLQTIINKVQESMQAPHPQPGAIPLQSLVYSSLQVPQQLHISLSRTMMVPTASRESFLDTLKKNIRSSSIEPFTVRFKSLAWFPNHQRSKFFLVLNVETASSSPSEPLSSLLHECNSAAREFTLPELYTGSKDTDADDVDAVDTSDIDSVGDVDSGGIDTVKTSQGGLNGVKDCFHVSIAWTTTKPGSGCSASDLMTLDPGLFATPSPCSVAFSHVKVKMGNQTHTIELASRGRPV